ncbi:ATP-dependent sacrificial sulfur transferase LarE [Clostridium ganghwense]|uniref:ATP-dependent sacrificial sulfur transferase LarE n=1 Tax=Clostridium ganghwense TaxID=312089 RepID=A0ABT4CSD3_9CLOT|nr:ATP-dependent sacrificial sulfur transferase LarE [Clostridium ganghwense]MCY6370889.1 ATP-dependent sacrificial sulfur transferase LarE [Clostridium ganghwense]
MNDKYNKLLEYLKELKSAAVAFSGGVDSTFLLKAAKEALGDKVIAVTVVSPYIPNWEIEEAKELVAELGIKHEFVEVPVIMDEIKFNPDNRCYLCKKAIFTKIKEFASKNGYKYVLDGTNLDDTKDYRPGLIALRELKIKSPLLENNLTKNDIRELSKELGLKTWKKPAYACLLSRIPYGNEIKIEELQRVEKAERYLMSIGFEAVRVRCHKDLARVEVQREDRHKLFNEGLLDSISTNLKEFGFKYVSLDMEGYRVGSLNETLKEVKKI